MGLVCHIGIELAIRCFAAHSDSGNECYADKAAIDLNLRNDRFQPKADILILPDGRIPVVRCNCEGMFDFVLEQTFIMRTAVLAR